jgi:hypothetical protein
MLTRMSVILALSNVIKTRKSVITSVTYTRSVISDYECDYNTQIVILHAVWFSHTRESFWHVWV